MPDKPILFENREQFREWLFQNADKSEGVWLVFGKKGGPETIRYNDAVEEAVCFGWIDGRLKSLGEEKHMIRFSPRRKGSNWSESNKERAARMEQEGLMTHMGRKAVEAAKASGRWDNPMGPPDITEEQVAAFTERLKPNAEAYANFNKMPPSARRVYTAAYLDAKTEETRERRLTKLTERITKNLRPM